LRFREARNSSKKISVSNRRLNQTGANYNPAEKGGRKGGSKGKRGGEFLRENRLLEPPQCQNGKGETRNRQNGKTRGEGCPKGKSKKRNFANALFVGDTYPQPEQGCQRFKSPYIEPEIRRKKK